MATTKTYRNELTQKANTEFFVGISRGFVGVVI